MKKILLLACLISTSLWADNCPPQVKRTHPDSRFVAVDNTNGTEDDSKECAWVVDLDNGSVNNLYSKFPLFVRWVR